MRHDSVDEVLRCKKGHHLNESSVNGLDLNGWSWACDACGQIFNGEDIVYDCSQCGWGICKKCAKMKQHCDILKKCDDNISPKMGILAGIGMMTGSV